MRVLVHEWITGGGLAGQPLPGSLSREGAAMRRAVTTELRAAGVETVVTLDARFEPELGSFPVEPDELAFTLSRLCTQCEFTLLIAPETGSILASLTRQVDAAGGRVLGSDAPAVALCADKLELALFLARLGIATPRTELVSADFATIEAERLPVVVKPRDGAGSEWTYLVRLPTDSPRLSNVSDWIIQPWESGAAMSASYLVADGRAWPLGVGWQDMREQDGRLSYHGGRLPAPFWLAEDSPGAAVRAVEGLRGFVGVDFLWQAEDRRVVIEINPRVTTSIVGLSRLYGPGSIGRAWLALARGEDPSPHLRLKTPAAALGSLRFRADGTIEMEG